MARLDFYRSAVKQFLQERADLLTNHPVPGLETLCIFDEMHDAYSVLNIGWREKTRVHYTTLLVRIRDGKIWVEEDGTEEGIANFLTAKGIPKSDIVLAFNPPHLRQLSEYAVA
jgi:hypothetical protein